jgi:hypothetical protein
MLVELLSARGGSLEVIQSGEFSLRHVLLLSSLVPVACAEMRRHNAEQPESTPVPKIIVLEATAQPQDGGRSGFKRALTLMRSHGSHEMQTQVLDLSSAGNLELIES